MNNPTSELKQAAASFLKTLQYGAHYAAQIAIVFLGAVGVCYLELGDFRGKSCEPVPALEPYSSAVKSSMDKSLAEHDSSFVTAPNKN